jgi:hypothetical protein
LVDVGELLDVEAGSALLVWSVRALMNATTLALVGFVLFSAVFLLKGVPSFLSFSR